MNTLKISQIKENPDNPRQIKRHQFMSLVRSIKSFPEMLNVRPLVLTDDNVVLGGNMRLKACIEAGLEEVPVIRVTEWSEAMQKEFVIKDNISYGEWDVDMLANQYEREMLLDFGLTDKELGVFMDEYEEEMAMIDNTKAEMPIVPKFSEQYDSVVIFCDNELDFNWIKNVLELKSKQDYKNTRVGECHVMHVKEFQEIIEKLS